jgi:hypothetical protein
MFDRGSLEGEIAMSAQASVLDLKSAVPGINARRSRVLAILLMAAIAAVFWVDSRYPALVKRYHAGTQIKTAGSLTFGTVYPVDRSLPATTRIFRTTVNWLDANRIGMTFSFLFGPAALTFLGTLSRRVPTPAGSTRSSEPWREFRWQFAPTVSHRSLVGS